ncbi:MAG: ribonuclease Y [Pirellulales bacterium]|nr:ribonuclease Y [Pirellulales bacterium]
MNPVHIIVTAVISAVLAAVLVKMLDRLRKKDAESEAKAMVDGANREIENLKREAELEIKEQALAQKAEGERELSTIRDELHERERAVDKRQDVLDEQLDGLRKQEKMVEASQRKLAEQMADTKRRNDDLAKTLDMHRQTLHELSGLNKEEATARLLELLDQQLKNETGARVLKYEKDLEEICQEKAREAILTVLPRYASAHTAETTTSSVDIPSDEMKGRIIGREGRNIRAFEKATGVDVIIDDTPGVVIVSAFDTVRREIARISLGKLIADGRIHPTRIEEIVNETQAEMEKHIEKIGKEAAQEADVHGLHKNVIYLLGRLQFRSSYSQNVLRHSIEVAQLSGMLAEELGMDATLARRAGLLHDIGKAADHEAEGGHPKIGADILKRCNESPEVVHAAFGHHDDIRIEKPYTVLVATSDACSASRPGARRETLDRYIKRMEELEAIAANYEEVTHAFAVQAGRELRVIVSAEKTTDEAAAKIAHDVARRCEQELTYPGEIKVTVIRETRVIEMAK